MSFIKKLCIVFTAIAFVSCIGIEMETKFNADGSGEMTIKIKVSRDLLEMGEEGTSGVELPLSEEELEDAYRNVDGVEVIEVSQEETETDRIITATIAFKDFNTFANHEEFPGEGATLREIDGNTEFTMTVGQAKEEATEASDENDDDSGSTDATDATDAEIGDADVPPIDLTDDSMVAMVQAFMEGYFVEYRIVAPKKIVRYSDGELSEDGKSVTLKIPMGEYFMIPEPYDLTVVW